MEQRTYDVGSTLPDSVKISPSQSYQWTAPDLVLNTWVDGSHLPEIPVYSEPTAQVTPWMSLHVFRG